MNRAIYTLFGGIALVGGSAMAACYAPTESLDSNESNIEEVDPLEGAYLKQGGTQVNFVFKHGSGDKKDSFLGEIEDDNGKLSRAEGSVVVGRDNLGTTLTLAMEGAPKPSTAKDAGSGGTTTTASAKDIFEKEVFPSLTQTCGRCHTSAGPGPEYLTDTASSSYTMMKGKSYHLASSALLSKGAHTGPALTDTQKTLLNKWMTAEKSATPSLNGEADAGAAGATDERPLVQQAFNGKVHFLKIGKNQTILVRADASGKTAQYKKVKSWCREDSDCASDVQNTGLSCDEPTCGSKNTCSCAK